MQGPRASKKAEYESVLTLINQVFRINNNLAPTMSTEYPLLLCYENMDNMRIILEDDQPVSTVSYCTTNMIIEGATLKAASVGSVCTHPGYRGRNYATQLMDDVEARMKDNGVEVMLVSGDRDLYLRRGCVTVGGFYKAQLESKQIGIQDYVSLVDINNTNIDQAIRIYNQEPVRYKRTYDEFISLQQGATTHKGSLYYKSYLLTKRGEAVAYIILKIIIGENRADIVEYAGDKSSVINGIYKLMELNELKKCSLIVQHHDSIKTLLEEAGALLEPQEQQGTIKIMNYVSLMNSLKPYMKQYLPSDIVEELDFVVEDEQYIITTKGESLCIDSKDLLGQLIFGQRGQDGIVDSLLQNELADKPNIKSVLSTVFPIPFPWTANMNYI